MMMMMMMMMMMLGERRKITSNCPSISCHACHMCLTLSSETFACNQFFLIFGSGVANYLNSDLLKKLYIFCNDLRSKERQRKDEKVFITVCHVIGNFKTFSYSDMNFRNVKSSSKW